MTYTLPDLWDHVAPPKDPTKKVPTVLSSRVPRFQTPDESPIKDAVFLKSTQNSVPSIETRPYTPFPLIAEEEEEEVERDGVVDRIAMQATPLGGRATSQRRVMERFNPSSPSSPTAKPLSTPGKRDSTHAQSPSNAFGKGDKASATSLSIMSLSTHNSKPDNSQHSTQKGPGFRFSKTGPVPTQWAIPACLPDVTYKRVSLGDGPNSAVILPVDPEHAEEELTSLMAQLSLPNKNAKIARSWAQTQFVAEHDPSLYLSGSPKSYSRTSFASTTRTIDLPPQGNRREVEAKIPTVPMQDDELGTAVSQSSGVTKLAKDMMDSWRPPQIFSKKPEPAKSRSGHRPPSDWGMTLEEYNLEKNIANSVVFGNYSRDLDILNYYNHTALSRANTASESLNQSPDRKRASTAPSKKTGKYNEKLQVRSNRKVSHFITKNFLGKKITLKIAAFNFRTVRLVHCSDYYIDREEDSGFKADEGRRSARQ